MKRKRGTKTNARRVQDTDIALGERIRSRRNQIEMSQEDLAKYLAVSFQQIQKYEKGANRLSAGRLVQLADALQCSVSDLIGSGKTNSIKSTPFSAMLLPRKALRSSRLWRRSRASQLGVISSALPRIWPERRGLQACKANRGVH